MTTSPTRATVQAEDWVTRADLAALMRRSEDTVRRAVKTQHLQTRDDDAGRVLVLTANGRMNAGDRLRSSGPEVTGRRLVGGRGGQHSGFPGRGASASNNAAGSGGRGVSVDLGERLLRDAEGGVGRRHAAVDRGVQEGLLDLLHADAVAQRATQMQRQLLVVAERDQGGDRDQGPGTSVQGRTASTPCPRRTR